MLVSSSQTISYCHTIPWGTSGDGLVLCLASPWEWMLGQDSSMALGTIHLCLLKTGAVVTLPQTWCPSMSFPLALLPVVLLSFSLC